jgi:preprotein translocase subunit SecE
MSTKTDSVTSKLDTPKMLVALAILILGIFGFYHYADQPVLYRVLGVLVAVVAAVVVFLTTAQGQALKGFLKASRTEMRKVVWPTRTETVQTTLAVVVMVLIVGIFLWLLDMLLGWIIRQIIGGA